jgi:hypothetical protein
MILKGYFSGRCPNKSKYIRWFKETTVDGCFTVRGKKAFIGNV